MTAPILTDVVGVPATITRRDQLDGTVTFDPPYLGGVVGGAVGVVPIRWSVAHTRWENTNTDGLLQVPAARDDVEGVAAPEGVVIFDLHWVDEGGVRRSAHLEYLPQANAAGVLNLTETQNPKRYLPTAGLLEAYEAVKNAPETIQITQGLIETLQDDADGFAHLTALVQPALDEVGQATAEALAVTGIDPAYISETTADPPVAPTGTRGAKRLADGSLQRLIRTASAWVAAGSAIASVAALTDFVAARRFVTPEMVGAVGDGTADDTAAYQYLLANAAGRTIVHQPFASYLIDPLTLNGRVNIVGNWATLKCRSAAAAGAILLSVGVGAAGSTVTNLIVDGSNRIGRGIDLARGLTDTTWERVTVQNIKAQGAEVDSRGFRIRGDCHNTLLDHVTVQQVTQTVASGGIGRGILISDTVGTLKNVRLVSPTLRDIYPATDADGVVVQDFPTDVDVVISDIQTERVRKRGVKIQVPGVTVRGGLFNNAYDPAQTQQCYSAVSIYAPRTRVLGITATGVAGNAMIDLADANTTLTDVVVDSPTIIGDPVNGTTDGIGSQAGNSVIRRSRFTNVSISGCRHGFRLQNVLEDLYLDGQVETLTGSAVVLKNGNAGTANAAPTRITIGRLGLKSVAQYAVTVDFGSPVTASILGPVTGTAGFGLVAASVGTGLKVLTTQDYVDALATLTAANLAASQGGMKRKATPATGSANGWTRLARIQSSNPVDANDNTSFMGTLYAQPDKSNPSRQGYVGTFSFGRRGTELKPYVGGEGDGAAVVEWRVYETADGWYDVYVNLGTFSLGATVDYRLLGGSEPAGSFALSDPTADSTLSQRWSNFTGMGQGVRHGGPVRFGVGATTGPNGAGLPSAAAYPNSVLMVSNPAASKGRMIYSDGAVWRYVSDDSAV